MEGVRILYRYVICERDHRRIFSVQRYITAQEKQQYTSTGTSIQNLPQEAYPVTVSACGDDYIIKNYSPPKAGTTKKIYKNIQRPEFDSYLESTPLWTKRLLNNWWSQEVTPLLIFLQSSQGIILVSDGGKKDNKGSYGVIMGTNDNEIYATTEGYVKGSTLTLSSFRCESYGILAGLLLLKHLLIYFNINGHGRTIKFYCDGKSVLDRLGKHRSFGLQPKEYLLMDIDVELQILKELNDLRSMDIIIKFQFVKGHQTITDQSTTQEKFNQKADELATSQLNRENSCAPFDIFPTMNAYLVFKQQIILGNTKNIIREIRHYSSLYNLILKRSDNQLKSTPEVWWPIVTKTLNRFNINDRMRIIKYKFQELYTKQRENKFDDTISPICICCHSEIESTYHIVRCTKRGDIIDMVMDKLRKKIDEIIDNKALGATILRGIASYITNQEIKSPNEIHSEVSEYLMEAHQLQTRLGWDQFCKGRWSISWEALLRYDILQSNKKRRQPESIAKEILYIIWEGIILCWKDRNKQCHNANHSHYTFQNKDRLLKEVNLYLQTNQVCGITMEDFNHKSIQWIKTWLQKQKETVSLSSDSEA
jgi:hypothetical protein